MKEKFEEGCVVHVKISPMGDVWIGRDVGDYYLIEALVVEWQGQPKTVSFVLDDGIDVGDVQKVKDNEPVTMTEMIGLYEQVARNKGWSKEGNIPPWSYLEECVVSLNWKKKMRQAEEEVEQILGKALGYPPLYPIVSNIDDGTVCVGPNGPASLAQEAAERIEVLKKVKDIYDKMVVEIREALASFEKK